MTTIYWRETALETAERYNIKSRIRLNRERQWSHLIVIAENRIDFPIDGQSDKSVFVVSKTISYIDHSNEIQWIIGKSE